jgi:hypothetical protein
MKRVRLDTTAYGDVQPPPLTDAGYERPLADCEKVVAAPWMIRRNALSRELVLDAQALFQERLNRPISEGEARNLLGNLGDFMWMLINWEVNPSVGPSKPPRSKARGRPRKKAKTAGRGSKRSTSQKR